MSKGNIDSQKLSPDRDGAGTGAAGSVAKRVKSNYYSRFTEVSRFSGAPAQAAYYASDLSKSITSDQLTADVLEGGVIGSGAGLVIGLVLNYFVQPYYRTGSHELLAVASDPMKIERSHLGIKADAAYVRWNKQLYYVNNVTRKCTLLDIAEQDFQSYFAEVKTVGTSVPLANDKLTELAAKIKDHTPCSGRTSTNPLYRNFKTLANWGFQLGLTIAYFLSIEDPVKRKIISCILSDICCFVIGIFAFPYWWIREKIFKIDAGTKHRYAVTGSEGWSKYTRTFLAFGISVGNFFGGLCASLMRNASSAAISLSIAFWGGVAGVASFVIGLIAVPLINWITSKGYNLCLLSADEEPTADKILKKTLVLKKEGNQVNAYFLKKGKVSCPVNLRLTEAEINALSFPLEKNQQKIIKNADNPVLVEKISSQCTLGLLASDDKNEIRNNYTRSGMTLGAGLGAIFGLLIALLMGNGFFGLILAGIIFSALGSVIGGVVFSVTSHKLHRKMHPLPPGYKLYLMDNAQEIKPKELANKGKQTIILKKQGQQVNAYFIRGDKVTEAIKLRLTMAEINQLRFPATGKEPVIITQADNKSLVDIIYTQTEDLENSWDYVTRCTASVFGFIGAAVVCLINPAAALLLVPLGTAIAGAIGWGLGILIIRKARQLHEEEPKSTALPWTQRVTTGANIGSVIGGILGVVIGFAGFVFGGPASVILAVSLFGALGAVIGSICGALWDAKSRALIWEGIKSLFTRLPHLPREPSQSSRGLPRVWSTTSFGPDMGSTAKTISVLPPQPKPQPQPQPAATKEALPTSGITFLASCTASSIFSPPVVESQVACSPG